MKKEVNKIGEMENYFLYFILYCFIGWLYEVVIEYFELHHGFVNRGFLHGPYLPVYGFGVVFLILLLTTLKKKKVKLFNIDITVIAIFSLVILITGLLEYTTSYVMELLFHNRWWDYSNELFNINGRVCLKASLRFGLGGTFFLYVTQPIFEKMISKLNFNTKTLISSVLIVILICDLTSTLTSLIVN